MHLHLVEAGEVDRALVPPQRELPLARVEVRVAVALVLLGGGDAILKHVPALVALPVILGFDLPQLGRRRRLIRKFYQIGVRLALLELSCALCDLTRRLECG